MSGKQHILITGTSHGFGRLAAEALARKGHKVFASMRDGATRNASARKEFEALAQAEKLDLHVVDLDVTDEPSVDRAVRQVAKDGGPIDVLINNAGTVSYGPLEAFSPEQTQRLFETNFFGALRVARAVLPLMRARGSGLLIHVSSGAGRLVVPTMGLYCASKFALEAAAETYRYELAPFGIDSVIVEPGVYPTNINLANGLAEDSTRMSAYGPLTELARNMPGMFRNSLQDPSEVVEAIVRLIGMAPGTRPLRTCVGAETATLGPLNQLASTTQGGLLEVFGMADLVPLSA